MAGISKKKIKTKGGKEVIKYTITYRDIFGKQHTSGYYDTLKDAKKDIGKFENINPDIKNITYEIIFKNFLEKVKIKYSNGTYYNYLNYCKLYFEKIYNFKYEKIDSITWQAFFNDIEKNVSPYTAQTCLKIAKAASNYAIRHNLIETNIFNRVGNIQLPKPNINHLTINELIHILKECKYSFPQYYALLYTFIGTGAREGEVFALEKADFNYREKTIRINKQFTKNELILKPKTEHSNRTIYIFEELAEVINEHIKTLKKENSLLFPNQAGKYHNASNFRIRFWHKLLLQCGITKRVRLHDIRGSYIDMLLSSGLSIKFAQNQVGHAKAETTLNVYAKNNADMVRNATEKIENIFSKKCEQNVSKNEKYKASNIIHFPKIQASKGG